MNRFDPFGAIGLGAWIISAAIVVALGYGVYQGVAALVRWLA